ncbi:MAG: helix-turn-helix domain-containing protein [Huintestinicola sp.]
MIKLNLHRILQDRGISQAELSRMTGIRPSTVCDLCNNNADFLKVENLDKICSVLKCNVSDIVKFIG